MVAQSQNTFSKTICSICYEDLKPIVEDLQAISICGHVFHEHCLQQWFGYCTNMKEQSCLVCKQGCKDNNVGRLYFQSIRDLVPSQSQSGIQKCGKNGKVESPKVLRIEVKRLEVKVSGLNSTLDSHQNDLKQVSDELLKKYQDPKQRHQKEIPHAFKPFTGMVICISGRLTRTHLKTCKEQLSKEIVLKNEALSQRECIQAMLQTKSNDLVRSNLECSKLKERNLALVKDIVALKLVSD